MSDKWSDIYSLPRTFKPRSSCHLPVREGSSHATREVCFPSGLHPPYTYITAGTIRRSFTYGGSPPPYTQFTTGAAHTRNPTLRKNLCARTLRCHAAMQAHGRDSTNFLDECNDNSVGLLRRIGAVHSYRHSPTSKNQAQYREPTCSILPLPPS